MINNLDNLRGKTVVVTGASGYISSALVDALVNYSCKVIRISRRELKPQLNTLTLRADVRSANTWDWIVSRADIIYHLAGNTSVYQATKNPLESLQSTLLPIIHLIQAAQNLKRVPRVVFASSATVYGLTKELPVPETTNPNPITVYDLHKFFAEQQLELANKQGFLDSITLRLANVYGPSSSPSSAEDRGILNKVISSALKGKDLMLYGGGNYLRDYVYITDVVSAFLLSNAISKIESPFFNVASGTGTSVKNVFELVAKQVQCKINKNLSVYCVDWPDGTDSIDLRNFTAEINKFTNATGWKPIVNLRDGVELAIMEFLEKT